MREDEKEKAMDLIETTVESFDSGWESTNDDTSNLYYVHQVVGTDSWEGEIEDFVRKETNESR